MTASSLVQGSVLRGRYRIEGVLGRGGMGVVYEARQLDLDRAVAIKVLSSNDVDYIDRFKREVKLLAALAHPNVLHVLDSFAGDDGTPPFLVTERLFGRTLTEAVGEDGPMKEARVVEIGLQLADALSAAHAKGIIHRDVKPGNVFLTETTLGRDSIKLLDFGVARDLHAKDELTRDGAVVGTLAWLSPEQVEGEPADVQSDVYALGATLFFCLFGRRPYPQRSIGETARAIVTGQRDSAASLRPGLALARIIDRAMDKDRRRRYATIGEVAADLRAPAAPPADADRISSDTRVDGGTSAPRRDVPRVEPAASPPVPARSYALPIALVLSAMILGGAILGAMKMTSVNPVVHDAVPIATSSGSAPVGSAPSTAIAPATTSASPSVSPMRSPSPHPIDLGHPASSTSAAPPPPTNAVTAAKSGKPFRYLVRIAELDSECPDGSSWSTRFAAALTSSPVADRIDACAQAAPPSVVPDDVQLSLTFDSSGRLVEIQAPNVSPYRNALTRCLETVIRSDVRPICAGNDSRELTARFGR